MIFNFIKNTVLKIIFTLVLLHCFQRLAHTHTGHRVDCSMPSLGSDKEVIDFPLPVIEFLPLELRI